MKRVMALVLTALLILMPLGGFETVARAAEKPEIMITSYAVDSHMELNESSYIDVTFKNMSQVSDVQNVLISFNSPNGVMLPAKGASNQKYVDSIAIGASVTVRFKVMFMESSYLYAGANFTWEYTYDGNMYNGTGFISVPLSQAGSVNVKNVNVTSNTTVGASALVNVSFVNNRKEKIYNSRLVISGVAGGEQSYLIGDVEASASRYAETFVSYDNAGSKSVLVSLVYEDSKGAEYSEDIGVFAVEVNPRLTDEVTLDFEEEETGNSTKDIIVLGIVGAAVVVVVVLLLVSLLKKKNK